MKTAEPTEEQSQIEHPLFEEALEEEDVKPESAIEKFKQVIDERQPPPHAQQPATSPLPQCRGGLSC